MGEAQGQDDRLFPFPSAFSAPEEFLSSDAPGGSRLERGLDTAHCGLTLFCPSHPNTS